MGHDVFFVAFGWQLCRLGSVLVAMCLLGLRAAGGEFINLDFESGNLSGSLLEYRNRSEDLLKPFGSFPFGTGSAHQLLPGWTIYDVDGNRKSDRMALGHGFFGQTYLDSIQGPSRMSLLVPGDYALRYSLGFMFGQTDGEFALAIDNTGSDRAQGEPRLQISQTGDVPRDAQWLTLRELSAGRLFMSLDEVGFPMESFTRDSGDPSRLWLDVSQWAGKTVDLRIGGGSFLVIDSIAFVVPEPSPLALFVMAGAMFGGIAALRGHRATDSLGLPPRGQGRR